MSPFAPRKVGGILANKRVVSVAGGFEHSVAITGMLHSPVDG